MKTSPIRSSVIVAILALSGVGCTAPGGGASVVPPEPAASVVPAVSPAAVSPAAVSPAASGGGKYANEYATPAP